jgi:hypothetical protein
VGEEVGEGVLLCLSSWLGERGGWGCGDDA